jgi:sulfite reductase (ferredoxin)
MVGGGLSDTPLYAQGLRVFIPEPKIQEQIPAIFRAIAHIFRDADELRYKRGRARLKFLVADRGWQWVRDELERRLGYALEHDDQIINPSGALHTDHTGVGEQVNGLYYVGVPIARGRWTAEQMIVIADLAERFAAPGQAQIRLSQKQNALLVNIPKENVDALTRELDALGLSSRAPLWRQSLVSCTGNQFCNLAVVETKERARAILNYLEQEVQIDTPIMVSVTGCPNACAQYQIADIGLTGIPVLHNGKKVDGFNVLVGGCLGENPEFGVEVVKKVPGELVNRVIGALVQNYKTHRIVDPDGNAEPFRDFVARHEVEHLREFARIPDWTPPLPKKPAPVA